MKGTAGWVVAACVLAPAFLLGQEVSPRVDAIDASARVRIQNPDQPGASPASTQAASKPFSGKAQAAVPSAQQPNWNPAVSATSKWGSLPVKSEEDISAFRGKEKNKDSDDSRREKDEAVSAVPTLPMQARPASSGASATGGLGFLMRRQSAAGAASLGLSSSLQVTPGKKRSLSGSNSRTHLESHPPRTSDFSLRHGFTARRGRKSTERRRGKN